MLSSLIIHNFGFRYHRENNEKVLERGDLKLSNNTKNWHCQIFTMWQIFPDCITFYGLFQPYLHIKCVVSSCPFSKWGKVYFENGCATKHLNGAHVMGHGKGLNQGIKDQSDPIIGIALTLLQLSIHLQDLPPPGSYEVRESYDVSQGKKEPAQPRTERGKRKKGSFLSSTRRFAPQRDVIIEKPEAANPG